jgi:hypothetical protein
MLFTSLPVIAPGPGIVEDDDDAVAVADPDPVTTDEVSQTIKESEELEGMSSNLRYPP